MRILLSLFLLLGLSPVGFPASGQSKTGRVQRSTSTQKTTANAAKPQATAKKTVNPRQASGKVASLGMGVVPNTFRLIKKNKAGRVWQHPKYKRSVITLKLDPVRRRKPASIADLRLGFLQNSKSLGAKSVKPLTFKEGKTKKGRYAYEVSQLIMGKNQKFRIYQLITWRGQQRLTWNYLAHSTTPMAAQKTTWAQLFQKAVNM